MEQNDHDSQTISSPVRVKESLIDRFAHWLERKTEADYSVDKEKIKEEGISIDDPDMTFIIRASRWVGPLGGWSRYSGLGRLIVTGQRVRVYSWGQSAIMIVTFSDLASGKVDFERLDRNRVEFRFPRDTGEAKWLAYADRKITVKSTYSEELYA